MESELLDQIFRELGKKHIWDGHMTFYDAGNYRVLFFNHKFILPQKQSIYLGMLVEEEGSIVYDDRGFIGMSETLQKIVENEKKTGNPNYKRDNDLLSHYKNVYKSMKEIFDAYLGG